MQQRSNLVRFSTILAFTFLTLFSTTGVFAEEESNDGQLPEEWYMLPEEVPQQEVNLVPFALHSARHHGSEQKLAPLIEKIFGANEKAIANVSDPEPTQPPSDHHPRDWTP